MPNGSHLSCLRRPQAAAYARFVRRLPVMSAVSKLLVGALLVTAIAALPQNPSRTRWRFEFRSAEAPMVLRLSGSLELGSGAIGSDRFSVDSGSFVLGDGSLQTLPPPLVPDPCVTSKGKADVIQTHDSVL